MKSLIDSGPITRSRPQSMGELIEPIDIQEPKYQTNTQQTHKKPIIFSISKLSAQPFSKR
jgi:hypothetical protein